MNEFWIYKRISIYGTTFLNEAITTKQPKSNENSQRKKALAQHKLLFGERKDSFKYRKYIVAFCSEIPANMEKFLECSMPKQTQGNGT